MKRIYTFIVAIVLSTNVWAQSPDKMSYQAVIRDGSNELVTNQQVGMQISILQGSANGSPVYVETQSVTSNTGGLVSLEIGSGYVVTGDFTTIDWAAGTYFIKTETDPTGGSNYTITGTSQLMSVPYALHAKTATNGITTAQADAITANTAKVGLTPDQVTILNNTSGSNSGDQDISGIAANATAITDLETEQSTQDEAIAANTAKVGITPTQASEISANTAKVGITPAQASEISANTAKVGITPAQASEISANTAKVGITPAQASEISANTAKVGITPAQASEISANTSKVGYTEALVSANPDVVANTAKNSEAPGTSSGDMKYWNGSAWVVIPATQNEEATLQMIGGVPTWTGGTPNVTNPATGKVWMDRNLGASQVATSSTDAASYGDLYQWGRGADGHQSYASGATRTLATSDTPGHGNFIINSSNPKDWRSPQNDNLWQGVNGINNPCPSGYRLPTRTEWQVEIATWSSNNSAGAFASALKLPMAGCRDSNNGGYIFMGSRGYYWSSTLGQNVQSNSSNTSLYSSNRSYGYSVRCLKD